MNVRPFTVALCLAFIGLSQPGDSYARSSTQTAFSPSPEAIKLIERTIKNAEHSVDVAAYSFTSRKIADALIEAHQRGVEVRVLLYMGQRKRRYPALEDVHAAGIPVRINHRYAIMHNKYIIIDKKTVETGSFNYTANAEQRNAENVIVIKNNATVAKRYLENWEKLWSEGEEYQPPDLLKINSQLVALTALGSV